MTRSSSADRIERVLTSAPINANASRALSGGEHYEPIVNMKGQLHSDTPLPTRPVPETCTAEMRALPGRKFGRFTVIGLLAEVKPGNTPAAWVCRCACGCYETRRAKSIRNPENSQDCCRNCRHLLFIKREYSRHGGRPIEHFATAATCQKTEVP